MERTLVFNFYCCEFSQYLIVYCFQPCLKIMHILWCWYISADEIVKWLTAYLADSWILRLTLDHFACCLCNFLKSSGVCTTLFLWLLWQCLLVLLAHTLFWSVELYWQNQQKLAVQWLRQSQTQRIQFLTAKCFHVIMRCCGTKMERYNLQVLICNRSVWCC